LGSIGSSAGEIAQNLLPKAFVVKAFNSVGYSMFFRPKLQGGIKPTMFICGNDAEAKKRTTDILTDVSFTSNI
jgi:predicted dinucleotide-binding enzyme